MRYEDWTFRETEVRLQEHTELRMALGLKQTPDYTTFHRFMRRLNADLIQTALQEAALQTMKDATGLAPGTISTFFINRKRDRGQGLPWRYWLKWVVVVETKHQLLLAQIAKRGPYNERNLIETVFCVVKRKLSTRAPGRSLATQVMQALILGLAYNLYKL